MTQPTPQPFEFIKRLHDTIKASQLARLDADAEMLTLTLRRFVRGPDLDACLAITQRMHVAARAHVYDSYQAASARPAPGAAWHD